MAESLTDQAPELELRGNDAHAESHRYICSRCHSTLDPSLSSFLNPDALVTVCADKFVCIDILRVTKWRWDTTWPFSHGHVNLSMPIFDEGNVPVVLCGKGALQRTDKKLSASFSHAVIHLRPRGNANPGFHVQTLQSSAGGASDPGANPSAPLLPLTMYGTNDSELVIHNTTCFARGSLLGHLLLVLLLMIFPVSAATIGRSYSGRLYNAFVSVSLILNAFSCLAWVQTARRARQNSLWMQEAARKRNIFRKSYQRIENPDATLVGGPVQRDVLWCIVNNVIATRFWVVVIAAVSTFFAIFDTVLVATTYRLRFTDLFLIGLSIESFVAVIVLGYLCRKDPQSLQESSRISMVTMMSAFNISIIIGDIILLFTYECFHMRDSCHRNRMLRRISLLSALFAFVQRATAATVLAWLGTVSVVNSQASIVRSIEASKSSWADPRVGDFALYYSEDKSFHGVLYVFVRLRLPDRQGAQTDAPIVPTGRGSLNNHSDTGNQQGAGVGVFYSQTRDHSQHDGGASTRPSSSSEANDYSTIRRIIDVFDENVIADISRRAISGHSKAMLFWHLTALVLGIALAWSAASRQFLSLYILLTIGSLASIIACVCFLYLRSFAGRGLHSDVKITPSDTIALFFVTVVLSLGVMFNAMIAMGARRYMATQSSRGKSASQTEIAVILLLCGTASAELSLNVLVAFAMTFRVSSTGCSGFRKHNSPLYFVCIFNALVGSALIVVFVFVGPPINFNITKLVPEAFYALGLFGGLSNRLLFILFITRATGSLEAEIRFPVNTAGVLGAKLDRVPPGEPPKLWSLDAVLTLIPEGEWGVLRVDCFVDNDWLPNISIPTTFAGTLVPLMNVQLSSFDRPFDGPFDVITFISMMRANLILQQLLSTDQKGHQKPVRNCRHALSVIELSIRTALLGNVPDRNLRTMFSPWECAAVTLFSLWGQSSRRQATDLQH